MNWFAQIENQFSKARAKAVLRNDFGRERCKKAENFPEIT
jgi:hypothetical protein